MGNDINKLRYINIRNEINAPAGDPSKEWAPAAPKAQEDVFVGPPTPEEIIAGVSVPALPIENIIEIYGDYSVSEEKCFNAAKENLPEEPVVEIDVRYKWNLVTILSKRLFSSSLKNLGDPKFTELFQANATVSASLKQLFARAQTESYKAFDCMADELLDSLWLLIPSKLVSMEKEWLDPKSPLARYDIKRYRALQDRYHSIKQELAGLSRGHSDPIGFMSRMSVFYEELVNALAEAEVAAAVGAAGEQSGKGVFGFNSQERAILAAAFSVERGVKPVNVLRLLEQNGTINKGEVSWDYEKYFKEHAEDTLDLTQVTLPGLIRSAAAAKAKWFKDVLASSVAEHLPLRFFNLKYTLETSPPQQPVKAGDLDWLYRQYAAAEKKLSETELWPGDDQTEVLISDAIKRLENASSIRDYIKAMQDISKTCVNGRAAPGYVLMRLRAESISDFIFWLRSNYFDPEYEPYEGARTAKALLYPGADKSLNGKFVAALTPFELFTGELPRRADELIDFCHDKVNVLNRAVREMGEYIDEFSGVEEWPEVKYDNPLTGNGSGWIAVADGYLKGIEQAADLRFEPLSVTSEGLDAAVTGKDVAAVERLIRLFMAEEKTRDYAAMMQAKLDVLKSGPTFFSTDVTVEDVLEAKYFIWQNILTRTSELINNTLMRKCDAAYYGELIKSLRGGSGGSDGLMKLARVLPAGERANLADVLEAIKPGRAGSVSMEKVPLDSAARALFSLVAVSQVLIKIEELKMSDVDLRMKKRATKIDLAQFDPSGKSGLDNFYNEDTENSQRAMGLLLRVGELAAYGVPASFALKAFSDEGLADISEVKEWLGGLGVELNLADVINGETGLDYFARQVGSARAMVVQRQLDTMALQSVPVEEEINLRVEMSLEGQEWLAEDEHLTMSWVEDMIEIIGEEMGGPPAFAFNKHWLMKSQKAEKEKVLPRIRKWFREAETHWNGAKGGPSFYDLAEGLAGYDLESVEAANKAFMQANSDPLRSISIVASTMEAKWYAEQYFPWLKKSTNKTMGLLGSRLYPRAASASKVLLRLGKMADENGRLKRDPVAFRFAVSGGYDSLKDTLDDANRNFRTDIGIVQRLQAGDAMEFQGVMMAAQLASAFVGCGTSGVAMRFFQRGLATSLEREAISIAAKTAAGATKGAVRTWIAKSVAKNAFFRGFGAVAKATGSWARRSIVHGGGNLLANTVGFEAGAQGFMDIIMPPDSLATFMKNSHDGIIQGMVIFGSLGVGHRFTNWISSFDGAGAGVVEGGKGIMTIPDKLRALKAMKGTEVWAKAGRFERFKLGTKAFFKSEVASRWGKLGVEGLAAERGLAKTAMPKTSMRYLFKGPGKFFDRWAEHMGLAREMNAVSAYITMGRAGNLPELLSFLSSYGILYKSNDLLDAMGFDGIKIPGMEPGALDDMVEAVRLVFVLGSLHMRGSSGEEPEMVKRYHKAMTDYEIETLKYKNVNVKGLEPQDSRQFSLGYMKAAHEHNIKMLDALIAEQAREGKTVDVAEISAAKAKLEDAYAGAVGLLAPMLTELALNDYLAQTTAFGKAGVRQFKGRRNATKESLKAEHDLNVKAIDAKIDAAVKAGNDNERYRLEMMKEHITAIYNDAMELVPSASEVKAKKEYAKELQGNAGKAIDNAVKKAGEMLGKLDDKVLHGMAGRFFDKTADFASWGARTIDASLATFFDASMDLMVERIKYSMSKLHEVHPEYQWRTTADEAFKFYKGFSAMFNQFAENLGIDMRMNRYPTIEVLEFILSNDFTRKYPQIHPDRLGGDERTAKQMNLMVKEVREAAKRAYWYVKEVLEKQLNVKMSGQKALPRSE